MPRLQPPTLREFRERKAFEPSLCSSRSTRSVPLSVSSARSDLRARASKSNCADYLETLTTTSTCAKCLKLKARLMEAEVAVAESEVNANTAEIEKVKRLETVAAELRQKVKEWQKRDAERLDQELQNRVTWEKLLKQEERNTKEHEKELETVRAELGKSNSELFIVQETLARIQEEHSMPKSGPTEEYAAISNVAKTENLEAQIALLEAHNKALKKQVEVELNEKIEAEAEAKAHKVKSVKLGTELKVATLFREKANSSLEVAQKALACEKMKSAQCMQPPRPLVRAVTISVGCGQTPRDLRVGPSRDGTLSLPVTIETMMDVSSPRFTVSAGESVTGTPKDESRIYATHGSPRFYVRSASRDTKISAPSVSVACGSPRHFATTASGMERAVSAGPYGSQSSVSVACGSPRHFATTASGMERALSAGPYGSQSYVSVACGSPRHFATTASGMERALSAGPYGSQSSVSVACGSPRHFATTASGMERAVSAGPYGSQSCVSVACGSPRHFTTTASSPVVEISSHSTMGDVASMTATESEFSRTALASSGIGSAHFPTLRSCGSPVPNPNPNAPPIDANASGSPADLFECAQVDTPCTLGDLGDVSHRHASPSQVNLVHPHTRFIFGPMSPRFLATGSQTDSTCGYVAQCTLVDTSCGSSVRTADAACGSPRICRSAQAEPELDLKDSGEQLLSGDTCNYVCASCAVSFDSPIQVASGLRTDIRAQLPNALSVPCGQPHKLEVKTDVDACADVSSGLPIKALHTACGSVISPRNTEPGLSPNALAAARSFTLMTPQDTSCDGPSRAALCGSLRTTQVAVPSGCPQDLACSQVYCAGAACSSPSYVCASPLGNLTDMACGSPIQVSHTASGSPADLRALAQSFQADAVCGSPTRVAHVSCSASVQIADAPSRPESDVCGVATQCESPSFLRTLEVKNLVDSSCGSPIRIAHAACGSPIRTAHAASGSPSLRLMAYDVACGSPDDLRKLTRRYHADVGCETEAKRSQDRSSSPLQFAAAYLFDLGCGIPSYAHLADVPSPNRRFGSEDFLSLCG